MDGGLNIISESVRRDQKPHIFLDLDNTILSSIPVEEFTKQKDVMDSKTNGIKMHIMDKLYFLYERPMSLNIL